MSQNNIDEEVSKDCINKLPDNLVCQILSYMSSEEAASTSILSKRWRYLSAHAPNLDFNDIPLLHPDNDDKDFVAFVNRVLELGGGHNVDKFSLKCSKFTWGTIVYSWICNVLNRGVSDLELQLSPEIYSPLPQEIFTSKTLVSLKIGPKKGPSCELQEVFLPKLKTLSLDSFKFTTDKASFTNLLAGCPVLEELALPNINWGYWDSCYVSSKTLERLTICNPRYGESPKSVSFDTPKVVYFEYDDHIAEKYPIVNFDSLVEAYITIRMTDDQKADLRNAKGSVEETKLVDNVRGFLMGISNVKILYISNKTLETLNFCCEAIPIFESLTHLTIDSHNPLVGWEALPTLLTNCPNLETLVFQGLHHNPTEERCGDVCLCYNLEKSSSSLSQCPVKYLTILNFGEAYDSDDDEDEVENQAENIKNFLKKMPKLEQLKVYYNSPFDECVTHLSSHFQKLEKVATLKCEIQVISDKISFSSIVPSSLVMKFGVLSL